MKYSLIQRTFAALILIIGIMGILNHFGVIHPTLFAGKATMSFVTAANIIICGVLLYFSTMKSMTAMFIRMMTASLLLISCVGIAGAYLFLPAGIQPPQIIPSPISMLAFFGIGMVSALNPMHKLSSPSYFLGVVLTIVGAMALIGHCMEIPSLYFYSEKLNNGLAFPTCISFILTGMFFVINSENKIQHITHHQKQYA